MKLTIDLSNPQDCASGLALLTSLAGGATSPTAPKAPPGPPAAPAAPAAPTPPAPPAPAAQVAPPAPAPAAPTPPAPPPAPAGSGDAGKIAAMTQAVNTYAKTYGAKAAKARMGEAATAFGSATPWTKVGDFPVDKLDDIASWFAVAQ